MQTQRTHCSYLLSDKPYHPAISQCGPVTIAVSDYVTNNPIIDRTSSGRRRRRSYFSQWMSLGLTKRRLISIPDKGTTSVSPQRNANNAGQIAQCTPSCKLYRMLVPRNHRNSSYCDIFCEENWIFADVRRLEEHIRIKESSPTCASVGCFE